VSFRHNGDNGRLILNSVRCDRTILSIVRSLAIQHFPVFSRDLEQLVADIAIGTLSGEYGKPVRLSAKKVNAIHDALPCVFQAEARFAQVPRFGLILNRQPKACLYKIEHLLTAGNCGSSKEPTTRKRKPPDLRNDRGLPVYFATRTGDRGRGTPGWLARDVGDWARNCDRTPRRRLDFGAGVLWARAGRFPAHGSRQGQGEGDVRAWGSTAERRFFGGGRRAFLGEERTHQRFAAHRIHRSRRRRNVARTAVPD
jgi:hypothetical protein